MDDWGLNLRWDGLLCLTPYNHNSARIERLSIFRMKTNAVRILDNLGISYHLLSYEVDPNDLAAEGTALKVGLPPEELFKTLVVRGYPRGNGNADRTGVALAVIPSSYQLDLKGLAKLAGDRKVEPVALKEVQPLTGYIRGGVTALACKRDYPVYVDELIEAFDQVAVSAGMRGLLVQLAPSDYLRAVGGIVGAIGVEKF
jgi:Cys-tRNA(Pro)/Cys-tRNA(Cys) deacylase